MDSLNNITNYKKKYLKYKIKYLELKGGAPYKPPHLKRKEEEERKSSSSCEVPKPPHNRQREEEEKKREEEEKEREEKEREEEKKESSSSCEVPKPPQPPPTPTPPKTTYNSSSSCELPKTPSTSSKTTDNFNSSSSEPSKPYIPPQLRPNYSKTPPIPPPIPSKTTKQNTSEVSGNWRTDAPVCKELKKKHCNDTHHIYIKEYWHNSGFYITITSHVLKHINSFNKKCIEDIHDETGKKDLEDFVYNLVNNAISKGTYDDTFNDKTSTINGRYTHNVSGNQYCIVGEWGKNRWGKNVYRVFTIYKCSGRYLTRNY
jgi:hypothetical protein